MPVVGDDTYYSPRHKMPFLHKKIRFRMRQMTSRAIFVDPAHWDSRTCANAAWAGEGARAELHHYVLQHICQPVCLAVQFWGQAQQCISI